MLHARNILFWSNDLEWTFGRPFDNVESHQTPTAKTQSFVDTPHISSIFRLKRTQVSHARWSVNLPRLKCRLRLISIIWLINLLISESIQPIGFHNRYPRMEQRIGAIVLHTNNFTPNNKQKIEIVKTTYTGHQVMWSCLRTHPCISRSFHFWYQQSRIENVSSGCHKFKKYSSRWVSFMNIKTLNFVDALRERFQYYK